MSLFKSFCARSALALTVLLSFAGLAQATVIYSGSMSLLSTDSTQLGRISRDGLQTSWGETIVYPGIINPATSYHYKTLTLDLDDVMGTYVFGQYLQIEIDSLSPNTFFSAYANSISGANYLGDTGSSGDAFPGDPSFFQITIGAGNDLVILMNETTFNAGLNIVGNITIEAFSDTEYTDLAARAVPEPDSLALMLLCLGVLGAYQARKSRRNETTLAAAA